MITEDTLREQIVGNLDHIVESLEWERRAAEALRSEHAELMRLADQLTKSWWATRFDWKVEVHSDRFKALKTWVEEHTPGTVAHFRVSQSARTAAPDAPEEE